jgi:hypothetical protein
MSAMRFLATIGILTALAGGRAVGQMAATNSAALAPNQPSTGVKESADKAWSFSVSAMGYLVPESRDYVQPTVSADHDWLHLEGRYNYENLETGSLWVGYNLGGGEKLVWALTPMVGGVFGDTTGVAPGYEGSLSWKGLELYSEGEFVFDTGNSSGNFFYTWSELSYSPWEWFRFGLAAQRTKAYQTDLDIQRGVLVGFSYKKVDFTTYVFNLGWTKPTWVLALGVNF